jgi:hypothetical protein
MENVFRKFVFIFLLFSFFSFFSYADTASSEEKKFNEWTVYANKDDFEGDVDANLHSQVFNVKGEKIGDVSIRISHLSISTFEKRKINYAIFSPSIPHLSGVFPDCNYDYTKYKIDSAESTYFPTYSSSGVCTTLGINEQFAGELSKGEILKISTYNGTTGVIKLKGFEKAWGFALAKVFKEKTK